MCETYPTLSAEVPGLALRVVRAPQLARVRLRRTAVGVARGVAGRVGAREEQAGLRIDSWPGDPSVHRCQLKKLAKVKMNDRMVATAISQHCAVDSLNKNAFSIFDTEQLTKEFAIIDANVPRPPSTLPFSCLTPIILQVLS